MELAGKDTAESRDLFVEAAAKYQLLVDSGIANPRLYANLANAFLQSDQPGRAIANYRRSLQLDPSNRQVRVNLDFANDLISKSEKDPQANSARNFVEGNWSWATIRSGGNELGQIVLLWVGWGRVILVIALSSLVFWGLLIVRAFGYRLPIVRWAIVPGLLLVLSGGLMWIADGSSTDSLSAIVVVDSVELRAGVGNQFDSVTTVNPAMGLEVEILAERAGWSKVHTPSDQSGWMESENLELL
jgi:hypothetical protein